MLTSLGAAWAKAPVVTDVVEDGNWCVVEIALGLWGLVGGVEVARCSSQGKSLENWVLQPGTQNDAYLSGDSLGQSPIGHRCGRE